MAEHQEKSTAGSHTLQCSVVTPEATVLETTASFVAMPLFDGEIGVAPGHSPFIGRLGFGELRVTEAGQTHRFYVDGGFVQVADNTVSVLTHHAAPAEQLSSTKAREELAAARAKPANSPDLIAIRDRAELQARAQLRLAEKIGK